MNELSKNFAVLILFGAKVSCKPLSSIDESRRLQLGKRMRPAKVIADRGHLENLSASDIHVKLFMHQEVPQEGKLSFPCIQESLQLFGKNKKRKPLSNKKNIKDFWSMTGDFIYRHHEVQRTKLYILDEMAFDVMRRTSTTPSTR